MPYSPPWPDPLRTAPFTVAEAAAYGVGKRRANGPTVHRPSPRLRSVSPVASAPELYDALARTLPNEVALSHLSAARMWQLPWSSDWTADEPVDIMLPTGSARIRRRGIRTHYGLEHRGVTTIGGLRVTSIADTWGDLAVLDGADVTDLVVAGDAIVCWRTRRPPELLTDVVRRRAGHPGVALLRQALPLVRTRSRSPMETRTRLRFRDGGLPEPALNAAVTDRYGQWVAESDFVWKVQRVVAEYEGAHHDGRAQAERDAQRREQIQNADWTYVPIVASTFYRPAAWHELLSRLRRELGC